MAAQWLYAVLVCSSSLYAQSADDIARQFDSFLASAGANDTTAGGMLVISRNGETVYKKVFGLANVEYKVPVSEHTLFEAASVSKQFTATSVLMLIRDGKLSLEDDVRKYIPELPAYGRPIQIKHLLTHTSGLKDWRNITYITGWPTGERLYTQSFALDLICRQKSLNFLPGERYSYSNSGFDLLAVIVERISGKKFAAFVTDSLLRPAGMTHSMIRPPHDAIVRHLAGGYRQQGKAWIHPPIMEETAGAAGLLTNAADLEKWNRFMDKAGCGEKVKEMRLTRYVLNNGDTITYGYGGVHILHRNGRVEVNHGGLLAGFRAWLAFYPGPGWSIAYTSNNREIATTALAETIRKIFLGEEKEPRREGASANDGIALLPGEAQEWEGVYRNVLDHSGILDLQAKEKNMYLGTVQLKQVEKGRFANGSTRYRFHKNGLIQSTSEGDMPYRKVDRFKPTPAELAALEGTYYSPDCEVTMKIAVVKGKLLSFRTGYDSATLTPVYRDSDEVAFRTFHNGLMSVYLFRRNVKGKASSFSISLPRAADIPFQKL